MTESPFRERRYRIEEVREVVKDALTREPAVAGTGRPLTRGEIGQLLTDLGVSTAAAERSLDEAGTTTTAGDVTDPEKSWLGGPRRIAFEAEVDGELADECREDIVEVIAETMGEAGSIETLGRTLTWSPQPIANGQQRKLSIKVRARDGRTRIRIEEDLNPVRLGAWLGLGLGGGFGFGALGLVIGKAMQSVPAAILSWVLIILLNLVGAWAITGSVTRRRKRELTRLLENVRREVARGAAPRKRVATPEPTAAAAAEEQAREAAVEEAAEAESEARENAG